MISKPWFLFLIFIDLALWMAALFWPAWRHEQQPMSLVVGIWPGSETISTANDRGMLPEEDINVVEMIWSSASVRAFENRVADAAVLGLDEVLRLKDHGMDIRVVLVFDFSKTADVILAKPAYHSIQELRGKKIGVSTRSSGMYLLRNALEDAKMTPEELQLVPINVVESETSFTEGELDAVATCEPWSTRLMEQGAVRIVDSSRVKGDLCRVMVVRADAIPTHRKAIQDIVNAHFKLLKTFQSMAPDDSQFESNARREGVSVEELAKIFTRIQLQDLDANRVLLDPASGGLKRTATKLVGFMLKREMIKKPIDCNNLTDPSFVQAVP